MLLLSLSAEFLSALSFLSFDPKIDSLEDLVGVSVFDVGDNVIVGESFSIVPFSLSLIFVPPTPSSSVALPPPSLGDASSSSGLNEFPADDDLLNLQTKDGDLGDDTKYIFCAPFELCVWVDVGVRGRELEPEVIVLDAGEVERGEEEVPNFLDPGGVAAAGIGFVATVDVLVNRLVAAAVLSVVHFVFISAKVRGDVDFFIGSSLFAAS